MNINMDMSLDELLGLWVKYSNDLLKNGTYGEGGIKNIVLINKFLTTKGILPIEIDAVNKSSFTISYSYKGSTITRDIPLK